MGEFIVNLFNSDGFLPISKSGPSWTLSLVFLAQSANLCIAICYFYIPREMYKLYEKRKHEIPIPKILKLLIWWSLAAGLSRLGTFFSFHWPYERVYLVFDWLCALAALILAVNIGPAIKYLMIVPSVETIRQSYALLETETEVRKETQGRLELTNRGLTVVIQRLEQMLKNEVWLNDKRIAINELEDMVRILQHTEI